MGRQSGMTPSEIAQQRLARQHLTQPTLATPAAVTRWFGAVQAQEYAHSLYGIGLRMTGATETSVERAIADRSIVRTWPMRGTIHLVPAEDARWMVKLLARRTNNSAASVYRRAGLTDETFAHAGDVLASALHGGKVMRRTQLYAALEAAGIATAGEQRGLHLLGYWAREGLICLGPREGKQPTFTLLDEWIPSAAMLEGEDALITLARRYFTSHGPATEYDFAWWAGITAREARTGMRGVQGELESTRGAGVTYWFSAELAPAPSPEPTAWLLPPYDEFTVAYKDRSAALDPAFPTDPFAILGPVVVVDGRLVGTWKRTLGRAAVTVALTLYAPLSPAERAAVERAVVRYGAFLGLPAVIA